MHVMAELTSMSKKEASPTFQCQCHSSYHPLVPRDMKTARIFLVHILNLCQAALDIGCYNILSWLSSVHETIWFSQHLPGVVWISLTTVHLYFSHHANWHETWYFLVEWHRSVSLPSGINSQCAMTLCSLNLQLERKTGPLYHLWWRAQSKVDCSGGGITWPPNMCEFEERTQSNKVRIYGLHIWSRQPGVQCLLLMSWYMQNALALVFMENTFS